MKKNKKRYQVTVRTKILITLTGKVYLQYVDEEQIGQAVKGDIMVFAQNEALHTTRFAEYDETGFSGYFKVDVFDGKTWQPVIISNMFPQHENHFGKKERPIDTYAICSEMLRAMAGVNLLRTYREHYIPDGQEG